MAPSKIIEALILSAHIRGGCKMLQSVDIAKEHSGAREATYKDPYKPSIEFPDPSSGFHSPRNGQG